MGPTISGSASAETERSPDDQLHDLEGVVSGFANILEAGPTQVFLPRDGNGMPTAPLDISWKPTAHLVREVDRLRAAVVGLMRPGSREALALSLIHI